MSARATESDLRGLDLEAVAAHLREVGVEVPDGLTAELVGGGKSNLTYLLDTGTRRLVLRRPPLGELQRGAHDVIREARVQQALDGSTVPVPTIVTADPTGSVLGVPFYVMDAVDADVVRTREDAEPIAPLVRRRLSEALVDRLADLHDIDPASVGLADLGRPDGYLERQVARWLRQYEAIKVRDLPLVEPIGNRLAATVPTSSAAAIVHGDYRLDNVMVSRDVPDRVVAVLDWEMATLGDPLADLATLVMFWDDEGDAYNPITGGLMAMSGFLTKEEVAQRYTARRGLGDVDLTWYLAFSTFKLAVILEQIHARHVAGQTVGEGFDGLDRMVDQLLAESASYLRLPATLS
ncbi:phosphotransferase family protein [Aeromicrobium alkaliterrae]|uniref:Phosphotransferase family protein n=1 Tax=Aeromicrobium alkaliterrae TaxID=302168 RepID=A0ABN2K2G3_9ACTN